MYRGSDYSTRSLEAGDVPKTVLSDVSGSRRRAEQWGLERAEAEGHEPLVVHSMFSEAIQNRHPHCALILRLGHHRATRNACKVSLYASTPAFRVLGQIHIFDAVCTTSSIIMNPPSSLQASETRHTPQPFR